MSSQALGSLTKFTSPGLYSPPVTLSQENSNHIAQRLFYYQIVYVGRLLAENLTKIVAFRKSLFENRYVFDVRPIGIFIDLIKEDTFTTTIPVDAQLNYENVMKSF